MESLCAQNGKCARNMGIRLLRIDSRAGFDLVLFQLVQPLNSFYIIMA